ncbi:Gfo/Idh/MocA family protein [Acuticoccus sp.]|uniref:Gfo/Idh/MocA family protein n=1 Tax=Acuticoccus sp. TaxID=1904378 RepID=UPI003B52E9D1
MATSTRRTFLKATAVGAGATLAGPALAQLGNGAEVPVGDIPNRPVGRPMPALTIDPPLPPSERLGWAICGVGNFAQNRMIPAIGRSSRAKLAGLISGNRDKALSVAERYGVTGDAIYDYAMEGLAEDERIAVVYVITPNGLHAENAVRAFEAGKHVMCEKPMANSPAECQRIIDAARAADRKLMIAYRAHFEPHNVAAKALIDGGALGEVWYATSSHHRPLDPSMPRDQWRMLKDLAGGGSLPDIGIYALNGIIDFFGETPSRLVANTFAPPGDPRFGEVEAIAQAQMIFPSGRRADISSGYIASENRFALIGSEATAELDPATSYEGNRLMVHRAEGSHTLAAGQSITQFPAEVDHFCQAITEDTPIKTPGEMGLRDVRLIEAIYRSAAERRWVDLNPDGTMAS